MSLITRQYKVSVELIGPANEVRRIEQAALSLSHEATYWGDNFTKFVKGALTFSPPDMTRNGVWRVNIHTPQRIFSALFLYHQSTKLRGFYYILGKWEAVYDYE